MLNRLWTWTSAESVPAQSGVPFGPLRLRAWTSVDAPTNPALTGLPFGPLRFRAWTSYDRPQPPPLNDAINGAPRRIRLDRYGLIQRDDEEVVAFLAALLTSGALH